MGVACVQPAYRTRDAEHTVLHQVIREHLESFLREAAQAGEGVGLPQFVEREFRDFLTCGVFEHGFCSLPAGGPRDWVALYATTAADANFITW